MALPEASFKYLRYLAFALGGLSTVIAAGALYLHATFDGQRMATDLSHFTKQRYQRSLRIDGPIELSMFPVLRLRLPATTLSGRNGGDFLGFTQASANVRLLPLLARRVVVEQLEVEGLRMALVRDKNGKFNTDDLMAASPNTGSVPFEFELSTLTLHHGTLNWNDEANGRQLALSELEMETGRLAQGADGRLHVSTRLTRAEPAWDLRVDLESAYHVAAPGSLPQLRQARLVAEGGLAGWQALHIEAALAELEWTSGSPSALQGGSVQIRGQAGGAPFDLRISTPRLKLTPRGPEADSIDASLRLDGKSRGGNVRLRLTDLQGSEKGLQASRLDGDLALRLAGGHLTGALAGPIDWQSGPGQLDLPALAGDLAFTPARSGMKPVKFAVRSDLNVDLNRNKAAGHFDLKSADIQSKGSWTLPRLDAPQLDFDVELNRLNLDTLLNPRPGRPPASPKPGDDGFDLSPLRGLDLDGVIRLGQVQAAGLKMEQVRLPLSLHGGRLVSAGHTLSLYGGSLEGSLKLSADDGRASYRGYLQNADMGRLLQDFGSRQRFTGTTHFFVEVSSLATSRRQLLADLQGVARIRIRNGSLPGIDMGLAMKEWRGALAGRQPARRAHRERESTAITELTAGFRIDRGIARSSDLQARNGMLQAGGAGEIDLPRGAIDYLSRVTMVTVPAGPDGSLLAGLRGATLPIRIKGPVDNPTWQLESGTGLPPAVAGARAGARGPSRVPPPKAARAIAPASRNAAPAADKPVEPRAAE